MGQSLATRLWSEVGGDLRCVCGNTDAFTVPERVWGIEEYAPVAAAGYQIPLIAVGCDWCGRVLFYSALKLGVGCSDLASAVAIAGSGAESLDPPDDAQHAAASVAEDCGIGIDGSGARRKAGEGDGADA